MHSHTKQITAQGKPLDEAQRAMIMVHGRGSNAPDILSLARYLDVAGFALLAPQATGYSWYPYSFMAPVERNEPGLSTGLAVLSDLVDDILAAGLPPESIFFLGFSQGACLTSEYLARHARRYGGAFLYSGGVIGEQIDRTQYRGAFEGTPLLLGCSDTDPHIPLPRVEDSAAIFTAMGADVIKRIYPNGPHTVYEDEIEWTNKILGLDS